MKQICLILFLFVSINTFSQVYDYAEYYIDHDPGYSMATPFTVPASDNIDMQLNIPTGTLQDGIHLLVIRLHSSTGIWNVQGRMFSVINKTLMPDQSQILPASKINYAEYFIDKNPVLGTGTSIPLSPANEIDLMTNIPLQNLAPGLHQLYVAVKDSTGRSCISTRMFSIQQNTGTQTGSLPPDKISYAEYFIDKVPNLTTFGTGTQIPFTPANEVDIMTNVPTQNLNPGLHQLYIAIKDSVGRSGFSTRMFSIQNKSDIQNQTLPPGKISYAEYFIDKVPNSTTIGTGTQIPFTPANEIDVMANVPTQNLNPGLHQLSIAIKDSAGRTGYSTRMFSIQNTLPSITQMKFLFDKGYNVSSTINLSVPSLQQVDSIFKINIGSLSIGNHKIFAIAQNSDGVLSKPDSAIFTVVNCHLPLVANAPSGSTLVSTCNNTSNYLVDSVPYATSYMWQLDNPLAGIVTGNGNSAQVNWNSDFTGQVQLTVKGVSPCGEGEYSAPLLIERTDAIPCPPSDLSVSFLLWPGQMTLTWTDNSSNETGFLIQRSINGGSFEQLTITDPNQTTYIDYTNNPVAGSIFYYRVFAVNGSNTSTGIDAQYKFVTPGSFNMNYIKTYVAYKDNRITSEDQLNINNSNIGYQYFDGLGRPIQNVQMMASPGGFDLVQPMEYDQFGRTVNEYLPFSIEQGEGTSGAYRSGGIAEQKVFYKQYINEDIYTSNTNTFDNSPLNRITSKTAPGAAWQSNPVSLDFTVNTGNEIYWKVDDLGNLINGGNYQAGTLYVNSVTDEDGHNSNEYKDLQGQVVLKESSGFKTYYVYDDLGLLRYVIPPKASEQAVNISGNYSENDIIASLCYYYEYNEHGLMKLKKIPGADAVYMVYDNRDLLVLSQDGELRKNNDWMFTKYDAYSRPIIKGKYHEATYIGQTNMQNYVKTMSTLWDDYSESLHSYSNNAFPNTASNCIIYSETYYDTKDYATSLGASYQYTQVYSGVDESTNTKGLIVATKTKVLLHDGITVDKEWLYTVNVYDKYGRVIQTIADNHKGGIDRISNHYNFAGELLETKQSHSNANITIDKQFAYDRMGRMLSEKEQLNNSGNWVTTSANEYNELGKLITYKIGGNLQTVDYKYNIRGWMTYINDPANLGPDLFAMQLKFNDGTNKLYSGNISQIDWKSYSFTELKSYSFAYDNLNRLQSATFTGSTGANYNENYIYDLNGNIKQLKRYGKKADNSFGMIDDLTYTYNGNQLTQVDDAGSSIDGFKDNGSTVANEITYNTNGNMITDLNKKISNPIQYNYLNLPNQVQVGTLQTDVVWYIYDAAGIKLQKRTNSTSTTTDYIGNFIYENGTLKYILTSNGRIVVDGANYNYQYFIKDHLGNTRVTFDATGKVLQEDSYYPFGMTINGLSYIDNTLLANETKNKYLYNGKEIQDDKFSDGSSLDWLDYGARFYDATLGRWTSPDPLDQFHSPYIYCDNNPITIIDPSGMYAFPVYWDGALHHIATDEDKAESRNGQNENNNQNQQQQPKHYTFDEYVKIWESKHGTTMDVDQKVILSTGCVGITALELGNNRDRKTGMPPTDRAYSSFIIAQKKAKELENHIKANPDKYPNNARVLIYAILFYSNSTAKFHPNANGEVDMRSWDLSAKPGCYNFDYGLYDKKNNTWWDANQGQPGMEIYEKSLSQFLEPTRSFNRKVFCVATTTVKLK